MKKWQEISVTTIEESMEAVANLFYEVGAYGVVIEDPKMLARYMEEGNWDACELPAALAEAENIVVKGYLPMDALLKSRLNEFSLKLAELERYFTPYQAEVSLAEIAEEDWATSWKAYFKAEKIGAKTVIVPSWESYTPLEDELIIKLDPGMAFGTGNHPTTAMSINFLEKYLQPGKTVLDVGTGSGVLAIVAAKLGAARVLALDVDPVAVQIAQQNIVANGMEAIAEARYNDLLTGLEEECDLIVANIIADVILGLISQAKSTLVPRGFLIVAGIITERWPDVQGALTGAGFTIMETQVQDEWVGAVARR